MLLEGEGIAIRQFVTLGSLNAVFFASGTDDCCVAAPATTASTLVDQTTICCN